MTLWRAGGAKNPAIGLFFTAIVVALLLVGAIPAAAETGHGEAREGLETLALVSASGTHEFSVEVMRTGPQRERGLMFRRFLPQDRGMLFIFEAERPVAMWMKNTYLPLDMIFIGKTGRVVGLAENAEPLSEKIIPSGAPAYGVLEVNAGAAAKIGLKIGDTVRYPAFGK
ncbi:DUF192 domain-containing protein [Methylocapsa polymorpha]|uniref:DUF192 domain-containing protein n=1 Tax=Methylocapsa polymorpha TaxID=3080828 RepID=UPI0038901F03